MINILLNFLGVNSWYVDFYPVKKYKITLDLGKSYKNLKTINMLNLLGEETPSPVLPSRYIKIPRAKTTVSCKMFYCIYTFYSLSILLLTLLQPLYSFTMFVKREDLKYLTSSLVHLNIALVYIWLKIYFRKNHFEKMNVCIKFKVSLIIFSSVISIIINYTDITSFYNEYYWIHYFDIDKWFFVIITVEWIYSRLIIFLFIYTFMFLMDTHIKRLSKIKKDLEDNEFDFEDNMCLSNIIKEISLIRYEISFTVEYFNRIISLTTIIGGLALAIFIRQIFPNGINTNKAIIKDHDRYLIHPLLFYVISNGILILTMMRYSFKRQKVLNFINSVTFINRFLSRIPNKKIMEKSKNINAVILNIAEESATTTDWIVLGNMLSEKWIDFTIFGISTADGSLIKKSLTIGGLLLFAINFLQENN